MAPAHGRPAEAGSHGIARSRGNGGRGSGLGARDSDAWSADAEPRVPSPEPRQRGDPAAVHPHSRGPRRPSATSSATAPAASCTRRGGSRSCSASGIRRRTSCSSARRRGPTKTSQGVPFVGRAGQLLTKMIEAMGLSRDEVYIANVLKCRPPGNRNPQPDEVETCEPFLFQQIASVQPKVIIALGAFAARTLLKTQDPISRLRGRDLRLPRRAADSDVPPVVPAAQPRLQAGSLGRPEEGAGAPRPPAARRLRQPRRGTSNRAPHPGGRTRARPRGAHLSASRHLHRPGRRRPRPRAARQADRHRRRHGPARSVEAEDDGIKTVVDVLDGEAFLPAEIVSLALWVAEYYACGAGEAIGAAMPPRAWIESERHARITDAGHARMLLERGARREILEQLATREAAARRHVDRRGPRHSRCGPWARARRPADHHPAARRQRVGVSHGARRAPDRAGPRGRTCRPADERTRRPADERTS